jgi:hypothetical protein
MIRYKPFGLGWLPDLPDHRDEVFQHAAPETRSAWEANANLLEDYLKKARRADALKKLAAAKKTAFGDDSRSLLLAGPPNPLKSVDLRPFMSPIENQGPLDSCSTHAVIALLEYLQIATKAAYVNASRRFLYKVTRNFLQWQGDTGAYIRETLKALRFFGVCPERYCDYDVRLYDQEPGPFCYSYASNYEAVRYYRLNTLEDIKQTLSQGYPVAFGFTCYESLFTRATALSGAIPYPGPDERPVAGHAVLAVGYFDHHASRKKVDHEPNDQGYLIIRNSWGTGWGRGGYGYLPYTYITGNEGKISLAGDFWTMTQMKTLETSGASAAPFLIRRGEATYPDGHPVTFQGGSPIFKVSHAVAFGAGSPLDEGDSGNWDQGAPVEGSDGGAPVQDGDQGGPVDGGDGGGPVF